MNKLNKLGLGLLIGYFLSKTINQKDFEQLINILKNKAKIISPKVYACLDEITNLFETNNYQLDNGDNLSDEINKKIMSVENEIEEVNLSKLASLLVNGEKENKENE